MFYLNRVILAGKLSSRPEVRYTQKGKAVVFFTLRLPPLRGLEIPQGSLEVEVLAVGTEGERWARGVKEGANVFVEGELFRRRWQDETGPRTEIGVVARRVSLIATK